MPARGVSPLHRRRLGSTDRSVRLDGQKAELCRNIRERLFWADFDHGGRIDARGGKQTGGRAALAIRVNARSGPSGSKRSGEKFLVCSVPRLSQLAPRL
jgi:hypothetical protein